MDKMFKAQTKMVIDSSVKIWSEHPTFKSLDLQRLDFEDNVGSGVSEKHNVFQRCSETINQLQGRGQKEWPQNN